MSAFGASRRAFSSSGCRVGVVPLVVGSILMGSGAGCGGQDAALEGPAPCTPAWYRSVEERVGAGDGQGHGPDVGSEEWRSVIEFRLGVRGSSEVPDRDGEAWCGYIDGLVQRR